MITHQEAENRVDAGFWIHVVAYITVVTGLAILNFNRNPDNLWFLWVAGGWGIGVIAHAATFFTNHDRMVARTAQRMERREDLKEERQERREERRAQREMQ